MTPELQEKIAQPILMPVDEPTFRGTISKADILAALHEFLPDAVAAEYTDDHLFRLLQEEMERGQARTNADLVTGVARRVIQAEKARAIGLQITEDPKDISRRPAPGGISGHLGDLTPKAKMRGR